MSSFNVPTKKIVTEKTRELARKRRREFNEKWTTRMGQLERVRWEMLGVK